MQRHPILRRAVFLLLLLPTLARAAQTVAVLPFRDLAGAKGSVGEAIRETVTSDLKDVPGLQVLERGFIDKIIAEQKLQGQGDVDPATSVKLGKLLGATLLVAGAYQRAGTTVRLTARFVRVETGEIVGTAKVDGQAADFLMLQDQVTAALLRSAGIAQKHVQRVMRRPRPKLQSFKALEYYGDALVAPSDEQRVEYLRLAVAEDRGFSYAVRDLEALETRMARARAVQAAERAREIVELRKKTLAATDPRERAQLVRQLLAALLGSRRYREMASLARQTLGQLPPPPLGDEIEEETLVALVQADTWLKDRDGLLLDGDRFQRRFPTSPRLVAVQSFMQRAIDEKRRTEAGREEAAKEFAALSSQARWDLCRVGRIYESHAQVREAQRFYRACFLAEGEARKDILRALVQMDIECADWMSAREDLAQIERLDRTLYEEVLRSVEYFLPADG